MGGQRTNFNTVVGLVLRYGVVISFAFVAFGSVLLLANGQPGQYPVGTTQLATGQGNVVDSPPLVPGPASAQPYYIIELGLLILIATPVLRVFVSIFFFLREQRYPFVLITVAVLTLLLFSMFVVGPLVST